jgi:hypothetical protein
MFAPPSTTSAAVLSIPASVAPLPTIVNVSAAPLIAIALGYVPGNMRSVRFSGSGSVSARASVHGAACVQLP